MPGPMSPGANEWAQRPKAANEASLAKTRQNQAERLSERDQSKNEVRPGQGATKANPITSTGRNTAKEQAMQRKAYEQRIKAEQDRQANGSRQEDFKLKQQLNQVKEEEKDLSNKASTVSGSGVYSQEAADSSKTLAENKGAFKSAEDAGKQLTQAEQMKLNAAEAEAQGKANMEKAAELSDKSRMGSQYKGEMDAARASSEGTAQRQEGEAQENYAQALDVGDESIAKQIETWEKGRSELDKLDANKGQRLVQANQDYRDFLSRTGANAFSGFGAALQSIGGFQMGISDRGLPQLQYNMEATKAANELAKQKQTAREEGARKLFDTQVDVAADYDKRRADMLAAGVKSTSDAQKEFAMPLVQNMAATGRFNEEQQALALNTMNELQKYLVQAGVDRDTQMQIAHLVNVYAPAGQMATLNGMLADPNGPLKNFGNNKRQMMSTMDKILQPVTALSGVAQGAANVVGAGHKDGGPINDNPNNEDVPDSVPAILAPGEFIISNVDVKKIRNGMGDEVLKKIASYYDGPVDEPMKMATGGRVKAKTSKRLQNAGNVEAFNPQAKINQGSTKHVGGGMAEGLSTGISAGSTLGPVGAIVGGALGTALGGIKGAFGMKKAKEDNALIDQANAINQTAQNDALLRSVSHGGSKVRV